MASFIRAIFWNSVKVLVLEHLAGAPKGKNEAGFGDSPGEVTVDAEVEDIGVPSERLEWVDFTDAVDVPRGEIFV